MPTAHLLTGLTGWVKLPNYPGKSFQSCDPSEQRGERLDSGETSRTGGH